MLNKLFESFYLKVFVNIVVGRINTTVYIETRNTKKTLEHEEKVFDTILLDVKMLDFISSYTQETPFYYVSVLDTSNEQGAVPECAGAGTSKYFDINRSKSICYFDQWTYYTSKSDLQELQKKYSKIGIDFIFSPFTLLARFFKDKIDTHVAMYILIEDSYISLSIFDNSQLLYADHIQMKTGESDNELLEDEVSMGEDDDLDFSGSIDLDEINVDVDMGELDDFGDIGDIEDLDNFEDMDDFSDVKEDIQEKVSEEDNHDFISSESETFNEDYERFLMIQNSVNHFYKEEKYESVFVESAYIADGLNGSIDLKKYLEEEMFLSVVIRRIDINAEMCDLAKAELQ